MDIGGVVGSRLCKDQMPQSQAWHGVARSSTETRQSGKAKMQMPGECNKGQASGAALRVDHRLCLIGGGFVTARPKSFEVMDPDCKSSRLSQAHVQIFSRSLSLFPSSPAYAIAGLFPRQCHNQDKIGVLYSRPTACMGDQVNLPISPRRRNSRTIFTFEKRQPLPHSDHS